jgi:TonB family protein
MFRIALGVFVFGLGAASAQSVPEIIDSGIFSGKSCGPEEVRVVGRHVTAPKVVSQVQPAKAGRLGTVVVTGVIGADGHACGNWHVRRSMGLESDQNAVAAITQWVFKPAIEEGEKPVAATVTIEVTFRQ